MRPLPSKSFFFLQKPKKSPKKSTKKLRVQPLIFIISSFFSFLLTIATFFPFPFLDLRFLGSLEAKNLRPIFRLFLSQTAALFIQYVFKNPARYSFRFYGCLYVNFRWHADILKLIPVLLSWSFLFSPSC